MLKELIEIANTLDKAGLTKEASELDETIKSFAQERNFMDQVKADEYVRLVESIKQNLYKKIDGALALRIAKAEQMLISKPHMSKADLLMIALDEDPINIS